MISKFTKIKLSKVEQLRAFPEIRTKVLMNKIYMFKIHQNLVIDGDLLALMLAGNSVQNETH